MNAQIVPLSCHLEAISTLAAWYLGEWRHLMPGETLASVISTLHGHVESAGIPMTFVAVVRSTVVGSAGLIAHDMDTRLDLSPWLACVYVDPAHRGQGIGSALVLRVEQEARELGTETLYLYTGDRSGFYRRLGWEVVQECTYLGYAETIMSRRLAPDSEPRGPQG